MSEPSDARVATAAASLQDWVMTTLGQHFNIINGNTPPRDEPHYWNGNIPLASAKDLLGRILDNTQECITEEGRKHASQLIPPGRIILSTRAKQGKVAITGVPVAISKDLRALEPVSNRVSTRYLYWYLVSQAPNIKEDAAEKRPLTSLLSFFTKRISLDAIRNLQLPLPPTLHEQNRIADILDAADDARHLRDEANRDMEKMLLTFFVKMFRPEIDSDATRKLDECVDVVSGKTPSRATEQYWHGTIPWISLKDMTSWFLDDTREHITDAAIRDNQMQMAPAGCVLIGVSSPSTSTRLPLAIAQRAGALSEDAKALVCRPGLLPEYLLFALLSEGSKLARRRGWFGFRRLSLTTLGNHRIPVPSLERQQRWAEIVADYREMAQAGRKSHDELTSLLTTLSARAFSGRLSGREVVPLKTAEVTSVPTSTPIPDTIVKQRPLIWPKLSAAQQQIWALSQTFDRAFSVDEFMETYRHRHEQQLNREYLWSTFELLVILGVIIKEGRIDADRWRRPHLETDREVAI